MDRDQPQREMLVSALDRAEAVLVESRDKVYDLRNTARPDPLGYALEEVAQHAIIDDRSIFFLAVDGKEIELACHVREEVELIGAEAIRNAAQHAEARRIECTLVFSTSEFRMLVSDDGQGFPLQIAQSGGPEGHFGLTGMRERAKRIGAKITITSGVGVGTQVDCRLAARIAYELPRAA
jgi:signal transduction histidine kinase